jgi:hypothetical protein
VTDIVEKYAGVWEVPWTVVVTGGSFLRDFYYTTEGPATWRIDKETGDLHIENILRDGSEVTLATHLKGTFVAVSQHPDDEGFNEQNGPPDSDD